ncbi:hypothetical protein NDU88_003030 [Pleurodeles waltl]|uniref:Uncharacterized protein n=1 Tax=Pleurodeles waltl TaxID=8319 RepID=A0AAV7MS95_PLEWA|nr:hypothetical protein NDU88_003030 [Pleurodeles waltl]
MRDPCKRCQREGGFPIITFQNKIIGGGGGLRDYSDANPHCDSAHLMEINGEKATGGAHPAGSAKRAGGPATSCAATARSVPSTNRAPLAWPVTSIRPSEAGGPAPAFTDKASPQFWRLEGPSPRAGAVECGEQALRPPTGPMDTLPFTNRASPQSCVWVCLSRNDAGSSARGVSSRRLYRQLHKDVGSRQHTPRLPAHVNI